ncbi:hypothetical protein VM57_11915 [Stenotrophomonas maltophilia]|uniref:Uncharacterized protein n=1 Tax=Stenotrophomonas maltophilia TaxID=40324 RepID=A0A0F5ZNB6_STEMA|nr:hypothetical protein VM57_11915 [Stenotrophomonas maltophilia]
MTACCGWLPVRACTDSTDVASNGRRHRLAPATRPPTWSRWNTAPMAHCGSATSRQASASSRAASCTTTAAARACRLAWYRTSARTETAACGQPSMEGCASSMASAGSRCPQTRAFRNTACNGCCTTAVAPSGYWPTSGSGCVLQANRVSRTPALLYPRWRR